MKLHKIIGLIFLLIITGVIAFLISKTNHHIRQRKNSEIKLQILPSFEFYHLNGTTFSSNKLLPGSPVVIAWFNPLCDHCNYETEDILRNIVLFEDIYVLLVSDTEKDYLDEFSDKYGLDTIPQITILQTEYDYFVSKFNKPSFPTTYIYNNTHHLVKIFRGEASAYAIISAIRKPNKTLNGEVAKD